MIDAQLAEQFFVKTNELIMIIDRRARRSTLSSEALMRHLHNDEQSLVNFLCARPLTADNFPDLASAFNCRLVECQELDEKQTLLRFVTEQQQTADMQLYIEAMKTMQEVAVRLSHFEDISELFRQAVIEAREHLYFDRIGFMLIDQDGRNVTGSWGTDRFGNVIDQSGYSGPIEFFDWISPVLDPNVMQVFMTDIPLYDDGEQVGHGWNLAVSIWDGERVLGWIACDNLLSHQSISDWQRELYSQFGRVMGHLYTKAIYEQNLRSHSHNLEAIAEQRSKKLAEQDEALKRSQKEMITVEKLATLGSLVAGIAHEVNTPIGISVTAASHLEAEAKELTKAYDQQTMTRKALQQFLNASVESSEIILGNLKRASDLVFSFKRFTADQTNNISDYFNVHDIIDHLLRSFQYRVKSRPIELINNCHPLLHANSYPSHVSQIFTNLLNNALMHAFEPQAPGEISLSAEVVDDRLILRVADNGKGIEPDVLPHIFEPFYTTKRKQGGTGIGLNVIHNLVESLGGCITAKPGKTAGVTFVVELPIEESNNE